MLFKKSSLNHDQKSALVSLRDKIIPLSNIEKQIDTSSAILSPISSTKYVHNINERKRKEIARKELRLEGKQSRVRTSSPLKRIDNAAKTPFVDLTNSINQKKL